MAPQDQIQFNACYQRTPLTPLTNLASTEAFARDEA